MINMVNPNEVQLNFMADGMEIIVGVPGNVVARIGEERY